jgi:ankyrin repeat protein
MNIDSECITALIEGGADVTRVDTSGRSAVAIAASNALESHALTLLSAASTSRNGGSHGNAAWLDTLSDGMAAFHWCINKKLRRLTRDIISFTAAPAPAVAAIAPVDDADDEDQPKPKKSQPKKGKGGAKKKQQDDDEDEAVATPATTTTEEKKTAAPAAVLSARPNLNVRNHKGHTALHMAIDDADWELTTILIEHVLHLLCPCACAWCCYYGRVKANNGINDDRALPMD